MSAFLPSWLHGMKSDTPVKLPRRRKSALTPTPSTADLTLQARREATAASPLFRRLPAEIRLQILTAAFGRRTLHMDVVMTYPPERNPRTTPGRPTVLGHAGMYLQPGSGNDGRVFPVLDRTARQAWHWLGSVCHRNPPGADPDSGHAVQPCQDQCRNGITPDDGCGLWPGERPGKCGVGALGWLRTCRQAYIEGIDILYGTNTIHTASKELVLNVDRLLLPQRVASITSLELLWDFGTHPPWTDSFPGKARELLEEFEGMLRALLSSFRGLKTLYISVQWTGMEPVVSYAHYEAEASRDPAETMLMRRIDAMVRQLPASIQSFSLAVPSSTYRDQCSIVQALDGHVVEHVSEGAKCERLWRPVSKGIAHDGYWVRLGQRDLRLGGQSSMQDSLRPHEWILYAQ